MGYFDEAKEKLRNQVKAIFENEDFMGQMSEDEDSGMEEFDFTGDVNFHVKVEDDGEYKEFYVHDEDGNIVEIFTSEMVDLDGRLPASVRAAIFDQYSMGDMEDSSEEHEDDEHEEDSDDVGEIEQVEVEDDEEELDEKLDPVGQEDADIDNDGDIDSSDAYLHNRRTSIEDEMMKEEETSTEE